MDSAYDTAAITSADEAEDAKSEEGANTEVEETEIDESDSGDNEEINYAELIASDVETLKAEFPELRGITDITDLHNPLRYAALRDLGLTPEEAYLATAKRRVQDTRAHLRSAHGRSAAVPSGMMSQRELSVARDLFPGMSDSDLQRLYKKVTK